MASTYGKRLKITIYGESHGKAIGMVAEGFPAGEQIDMEELGQFLARRSAIGKKYTTARKEADVPVILSGMMEQPSGEDGSRIFKILNSPVSVMIENKSHQSSDYSNLKDIPRPGHADFAAMMRYEDNVDLRGGGHFSGRLTAPLCVAGGMAKQILFRRGIEVKAQMIAIGGISGVCSKDPVTGVHMVDDAGKEAMMDAVAKACEEGDSVGGIIECVVEGLSAGACGDHMFDGMEGRISQAVFGIPAIKAIEFGNGFECAGLRGSVNNDAFYVDQDGKIRTETNNHGGILGGTATGMPVVFRVAVKPTPSIFMEQKSVSLSEREGTCLEIKGRHDPCIVERAVPCIEAAAALAILDGILDRNSL